MLLQGQECNHLRRRRCDRRRGGAGLRSRGGRLFLAGRTLARLDVVAGQIRSAGGIAETAAVDAVERSVDEHADAVVAMAGSIDVSFNVISQEGHPGDAAGRDAVVRLHAAGDHHRERANATWSPPRLGSGSP